MFPTLLFWRASMSLEQVDFAAIEAAAARLSGLIRETPIVEVGRFAIKMENQQITGSFKLRGALNRLLQIPSAERGAGVVAASAGNHGKGVAHAAAMLGIQAVIVLPARAVETKAAGIRAAGAEIIHAEGDYAAAEVLGQQIALEHGANWVSPYNDPGVIAGQGSLGIELYTQLIQARQKPSTVFLPAGGGGLLCGVGVALRTLAPKVRVIGVQPQACAYLHAHFFGLPQEKVEETPTLADGLAGAVEAGSLTFEILPRVVDDMILVSEEEILEALRWCWKNCGEVVEPSAAVALAGAKKTGSDSAVVVLSGGNVDADFTRQMINGNANAAGF